MGTNNGFITLDVPDSPSTGAFSDVSGLSFGMTLIVDGPASSTGELLIEVNLDGVGFVPFTAVFPVHNPPSTPLNVVATLMRVQRISGSGPVSAVVGSANTDENLFAIMDFGSVDTSEMGPLRNVSVIGEYSSPIVIEGSNDGVNYDSIGVFDTQDSNIIFMNGTWATMRVKPGTFPSAGVTISVAGGFPGQPASGLSGIQEILPSSPLTTVTNNFGPTSYLGQYVAADWDVGITRVYAVDGINGSNLNAGFFTPASDSQADYEIACTIAGQEAVKTFSALINILPRYGRGRNIEIVIANGGVNTAQSYLEALEIMVGGLEGWAFFGVRATGTNPTAGCVAFDGTSNDLVYQGGVTVTGLNVDGYNPNGASTTSLPCVLNGGGAPALPGDPLPPLGWRVRFAADTATPGLQNQCRQIARVTGGNTIVPGNQFSDVPADNDVFFIEQPGVNVAGSILSVAPGSMAQIELVDLPHSSVTFNVSGIYFNDFLQIGNCQARIAFAGGQSVDVQGDSTVLIEDFIVHPFGFFGRVGVGGGYRSDVDQILLFFEVELRSQGFVQAGSDGIVVRGLNRFVFGDGSYVNGDLSLTALDLPLGENTIGTGGVGPTPARMKTLHIQGSQIVIAGALIEGAGVHAAITVIDTCVVVFAEDGACSGSVGNNDVGLDLRNSHGSFIVLGATPTVTGVLGDVRLAGGQIVPWSQLAATGFTDSAGNRIIPANVVGQGTALGYASLSGSILGGGAPTFTYLADVGTGAVANQTTALRRPSSLRLFLRLLVTNISNTATNAVTVTLYKNGLPTAMQVNIPPGSGAYTKFIDAAHPILLLNNDDWDVRLDDLADVGAIVAVSVGVEWST